MKIQKESIKYSIIITFTILTTVTFSIVGFFVFSTWESSIENVIIQTQNDAHQSIIEQVEIFLNSSCDINNANFSIFQYKLFDIHARETREKYFSNILNSTNQEVYSFSYGMETGEYYGARRNKNNEIEVMENNVFTDGKTRYYSVNATWNAEKLVMETQRFDPRTRDWYIIAKQAHKLVFSPIYKHFIMDDLAISIAYPIYNEKNDLEGVLGTHITLSKINDYLKELPRDHMLNAYIVEKNSGYVVANSMGEQNFKILEQGIKRISIEEIGNKDIIESYQKYKSGVSSTFTLTTTKGKNYIKFTEYKKEGIDWVIITTIPEYPFIYDIIKTIQVSLLLSIIAIFLAIVIFTKSIHIFLKPIYNLIDTTEAFSAGDFSQRAPILRNDEIGKLTYAFNKMAEQIDMFVNSLEDKIRERTAQLEEANVILALRTQELKDEKDLAVKNYTELSALYDIAAKVQHSFLPAFFENEYIKIKHIYKPIQRLSGDTLDYTWLSERQTLCGFIVDVCGHGLVAALQANVLYGLMNELHLSKVSLNEKLNFINQASLRYFDETSYATVIYFELDILKQVLKISAGGNNHFLASCKTEQGIVDLPGSLIGMFEKDVEFFELSLNIQAGDIFSFCSDGLFDLIKQNEIKQIDCDALYNYLIDTCDKRKRWDDASAICFEIKGKHSWPLIFELNAISQLRFLRLRIKRILRNDFPNEALILEIAINEALNNAVMHGKCQQARISLKINLINAYVVIRIKQNYTTFNANSYLERINDNTFAECIEQESGRGLAIIKSFMNRIIFNRDSTEILMTKKISD